MNKFILSILIFFLLANYGTSEIVDYIVAVVNTEPITFSMIQDAMNSVWNDVSLHPKTTDEAIQSLIDHKLKLQEARRRGIFVTEEELSSELLRISSNFGSTEKLASELNKKQMTLDDLKASLNENIMIQKMIERKFGLFIRDSDLEGEATSYFEQYKTDFVINESVLLDQISFKLDPNLDDISKADIRKKAELILSDLENGASFSKYSNGARMGYVGIYDLNKAFLDALEKMNIGDFSDIIDLSEGYYIIKLNDRRLSRQATFAEVREQIISQLRKQKIEADLQADLKTQRENADIRINKRK